MRQFANDSRSPSNQKKQNKLTGNRDSWRVSLNH